MIAHLARLNGISWCEPAAIEKSDGGLGAEATHTASAGVTERAERLAIEEISRPAGQSLFDGGGRLRRHHVKQLELRPRRFKSCRFAWHEKHAGTFLAWVRTSISVIVFGFVVAKFGITLRQFFRFENLDAHESGISLALGVSFMVVGILMAILAVWRYQSTRVQIDSAAFRPPNKTVYVVGGITALLGAMLIYYLLTTTSSL